MNGTSFAAPLVAGAAALMIARAMRRSTPLTALTVRDLLQRSAAPFVPGDPAQPRHLRAAYLMYRQRWRPVDEESQAERLEGRMSPTKGRRSKREPKKGGRRRSNHES